MWRFVAVLVLALVLPAAAHAAGPAVGGKLVDEHGAPVAGATVTVYPALDIEGETVIEPLASAVTDRLGRFAVSAVPSPQLAAEQERALIFSAPQRRGRNPASVTLTSRRTAALDGRPLAAARA